MKNIKNLKDIEITFVVNSLGEKLKDIQKEAYDKYCEIDSISKWLNYLVQNENGEYLIYSCLEFFSNENHGIEAIELDKVKTIAEEIGNSTKLQVYLGEYYGFDECHEIAVLIPLNTEKEIVEKEYQILNKYI